MQHGLDRFVRGSLVLAAAASGLLGGVVVTLARHAPSEQDLRTILTNPQIHVDARYLLQDGKSEFVQHASCRCGLSLPSEQIPRILKQALTAREDSRFHVHRGIDWIGLARALLSNLAGRSMQGGSTLTQQLVKNLITGNARSGLSGLARKIREAIIARRAERALTKEQILTAYLNQIDFGSTDGATAIGVTEAARKYFGKDAQTLNLYEAAMLVGMLRATTTYNPIVNPDAADQQARDVLQKMVAGGSIGQRDLSRAVRLGIQRGSLPPIAIAAGHYIAWSRAELADIARSHPTNGAVRYVVGLDTWRQLHGEAAIRELIARNGGLHVGQGALVSLENDGRVSSLVGGSDYASSQFDRATQARRQPGSAFKPVVYAAAIRAGLDPGTIRLDSPIADGDFRPDNADHKFLGPIPLTTALALSRNTVAVRLGREVGIGSVVEQARELGIRSPLRRDLSLVFGTSEVTLLELTAAYVPFMNDGRVARPYAAVAALDASGRIVYRHDPAPGMRVLNARTVRAMRQMLRAVVTEGTGRRAQLRDRWSAGKTGTSQGNRDAWFVGFTDHLATGIWFGNDDNSQMTGISGAGMPVDAWRMVNEGANAPPAAGPPSGALTHLDRSPRSASRK